MIWAIGRSLLDAAAPLTFHGQLTKYRLADRLICPPRQQDRRHGASQNI